MRGADGSCAHPLRALGVIRADRHADGPSHAIHSGRAHVTAASIAHRHARADRPLRRSVCVHATARKHARTCALLCAYTRKDSHTYTHTHTQTHTCARAHAHTRTQARTCTHTHASHTHACTHARKHAHARTCTLTHAHACTAQHRSAMRTAWWRMRPSGPDYSATCRNSAHAANDIVAMLHGMLQHSTPYHDGLRSGR